jgi:hypothetical protein
VLQCLLQPRSAPASRPPASPRGRRSSPTTTSDTALEREGRVAKRRRRRHRPGRSIWRVDKKGRSHGSALRSPYLPGHPSRPGGTSPPAIGMDGIRGSHAYSRLAAPPRRQERRQRASPPLFEQLIRRDLKGFRQPPQRRDLRIALPCLDPADLRGVNTTAKGDLFLRKAEAFARLPQVGAEVGHAGIVCSGGRKLHRKFHKSSGRLSPPLHPAMTARRGPTPAPAQAGRDRPSHPRGLAVLGNTQGRADLRDLRDPHLCSPPSLLGPSGDR